MRRLKTRTSEAYLKATGSFSVSLTHSWLFSVVLMMVVSSSLTKIV